MPFIDCRRVFATRRAQLRNAARKPISFFTMCALLSQSSLSTHRLIVDARIAQTGATRNRIGKGSPPDFSAASHAIMRERRGSDSFSMFR
ncbi:MAG: hypothetical protein BGN91_12965 [Nitrobacter sp. 62-13]|jgi:hypothetical protein|nr:MAG: hypothetical protein BGN91_12965 [Nitrobacter sp. 62-13]